MVDDSPAGGGVDVITLDEIAGVGGATHSLNSPPWIEDSGNHSEINDRRVSEQE
jgi:hypothetical protein